MNPNPSITDGVVHVAGRSLKAVDRLKSWPGQGSEKTMISPQSHPPSFQLLLSVYVFQCFSTALLLNLVSLLFRVCVRYRDSVRTDKSCRDQSGQCYKTFSCVKKSRFPQNREIKKTFFWCINMHKNVNAIFKIFSISWMLYALSFLSKAT